MILATIFLFHLPGSFSGQALLELFMIFSFSLSLSLSFSFSLSFSLCLSFDIPMAAETDFHPLDFGLLADDMGDADARFEGGVATGARAMVCNIGC
jgi:hypothetical protein